MSLDLLCSLLYVPCYWSASLDFTFSLPNGDVIAEDSFCDNGFYQDVKLSFQTVGFRYLADMEAVGGWFSCIAKGTGGEERPGENTVCLKKKEKVSQ